VGSRHWAWSWKGWVSTTTLSTAAGAATAHLGALGYVAVGIFVTIWVVSFVIYRAMRYHKISKLDHL